MTDSTIAPTGTDAAGRPLPSPTATRWMPLRLGLVDLFYYDEEVFPFVDGRLLLRGNNGAGKSKVLALTLPFLLDGDLSAHRIEPDGDRQKRMEWNLLLGGEHPNNERTGYTWLEFGRIDEQGEAQFTTIGAGLKAVRGKAGIAKHWFFITGARVGESLSLTDSAHTVLSKQRLEDALLTLGDGHVYEGKNEYRRAIDERLFGLGERRYGELMELLLQIRAPQLSKRPSETALDAALRGSLTPVGDDVIASVANGLRSLDEVRDELDGLRDVRGSLSSFLDHYRAYAQVQLRRRADGPRRDQADHDRFGRELIAVNAARAEHVAARDEAIGRLTELRTELSEREGEREALRDSEHANSERQIASAEDNARAAAARAETATAHAERASQDAASARSEAGDAEAVASERRAAVGGALEAATAAAMAAGVEAGHAAALAESTEAALAADRSATDGRITTRRAALDRISGLRSMLETAEAQTMRALSADADAESRRAEAEMRAADADAETETTIAEYLEATSSAIDALAELAVDDNAFAEFAKWVRRREGADPLTMALHASASALHEEIHTERARARIERHEQHEMTDALRGEIEALESGTVPDPASWPTRTASPPESTPLWRATGFADHLDERARAGLEAALEASGLLTAVLHQDGEVRSPEHGEVLLRAGAAPVEGPSLAEALVVELPAETGLDESAVTAVLRAVALGERQSGVWVGTDGAFGFGPARGAWHVDSARYIGETARAAARAARARAAREELDAAERRIAELDEILAGIAARLTRIQAETRAVPEPNALATAEKAAAAAHTRAQAAAAERERTAAAVAAARTEQDARAAELETDAAVLGLPSILVELNTLAVALTAYEKHSTEFAHTAERFLTADEAARAARRRAESAESIASQRGAELDAADDESRRARAYATTVSAQFGAAVTEYRTKVAEVETAVRSLGKQIKADDEVREQAALEAARLETRVETLTAELDRAAASRAESVTRLRRTIGLGIAEVAVPELDLPDAVIDWTATTGVQAARAIESALSSVDHSESRSERLTNAVLTHITELQRDLSRHDYEVAIVQPEAGIRVFVASRGVETTLPALDSSLAEQIDQHERMLSAREREIIQNHLVTEVGTQLSELIGAADKQIAELNHELRARPTSTGMILRVRWVPRTDGPDDLAGARRILGSIADVWSETERASLGDFLQARIAAVRDSDETGNWYDHLGAALDYRTWHRFIVERKQGDSWRAATGPASGGERVLAASIPLFAAASSHYRTASNPHAPRLVMLDEAFAGVDDDSRANCLGLLAEFDLDVVMTSEREWGCYAEVPGLSIAQLSRFDDTPAVYVQLWRWNGRRRERIDIASPADEDGGLW